VGLTELVGLSLKVGLMVGECVAVDGGVTVGLALKVGDTVLEGVAVGKPWMTAALVGLTSLISTVSSKRVVPTQA
jgi:hypothetical protein